MQNHQEPSVNRKDAAGHSGESGGCEPMSEPLKLGMAFEIFDRLNANGEIPDRRTGKPKKRSAGKVDVIRSHVRGALSRAADVPDLSTDELAEVDILPFVTTLAHFAGKGDGKSARRARSNVRLFLAVVLGQEYEISDRHGHANRAPVTAERALPKWRPLYDVLESEDTRRSFPGQLLALQDLAVKNDIHDPHDLPDDFDTIARWAEEAGLKRKKVHAMTAAFRHARDLLGGDNLPTLFQQVQSGERGLRSLPDLAERLEAHGCTKNPRDMTALELLEVLAPKLGLAIQKHLKDGRRRNLSPSWEDEQIGMASRLAASLIRLGHDTTSITFLDLFEREIEIRPVEEDNELLKEVIGSEDTKARQISLIRQALDEAAHLSCDQSPLTLLSQEELGPNEVPWYTAKVRTDLLYACLATRFIYGGLQDHDSDRWGDVEKRYERLRDAMITYNEGRRLSGQKPKKKVLITWPQAVVIGLRHLRRKVQRAEGKLNAYLDNGGRSSTQRGKRLLLKFDKAVRAYVLVAVMLDDGLRIKNYAGAQANVHFLPEVERDKDGNWIRLIRVDTHFRGFDHPAVSLKIDEDELGAERSRTRQLTPAIVDHDLLLRYWIEVRARDLVRRGLLESIEDYDPNKETFAFFVAPRTGGRLPIALKNYDPETHIGHEPTQVRARRIGSYTTDQLSKKFGRPIHEVVRRILKRDVPAWNDPLRTKEWRGVFSGHITRLLIASYWGGIRGDWVHACWLTDDTPETLQRSYIKIRSEVVAHKKKQGIENIEFYDMIIDRMLQCVPSDDWATFWDELDPAHPDDAFAAATAPSSQPKAVRPRGGKEQYRKAG